MIRSCLCGRSKVDDEVYPKATHDFILDCSACESTPYIRPADATAYPVGKGWLIFTEQEAIMFAEDVEHTDPLFRHIARSSTPELSSRLYRRGRSTIELHPDAKCVQCGKPRDTSIRGPLCTACENRDDDEIRPRPRDPDPSPPTPPPCSVCGSTWPGFHRRLPPGHVWGASCITPELLAEQAAENARQSLKVDARSHARPNFYGPGGPWGPSHWYDFALPVLLTLRNTARRVRASLRRS